MRAMEEEREALLDHVDMLIAYWASEMGNVAPDTPKREALEGLAFSIMVVLDGGASVGPYAVQAIEEGSVGPDIAGGLHEQPGHISSRSTARWTAT